MTAGNATIIKCVQTDGSVVYTNLPCPGGKVEAVVLEPLVADVKLSLVLELSVVLGIYLAMSVICFLVYRLDKVKAVQGERRIPEKTLHWLEMLGGWPGGLVAQRLLRHKNRKTSYQIEFWLIVLVHVILWAYFAMRVLNVH